MSTTTVMGNSDGPVTGLCTAPPPPPPPPPVPGQVPSMRINTAEAPTIKRPQITNNGAYEPPAAIQNAMLTKDKKPFTYTPGMGGKLDLSQIRSPRMARRVAKNANDEGIEGPPKSALEPKPNIAPNLFVQPQVAIPVFPTNIPIQTPGNKIQQTVPILKGPSMPPGTPANRTQSSTPEKQPESPKAVTKAETKVPPVISIQPSTPETPSTPTQVTLTKAPTPWLQNKNKPQEELPEWAKRAPANKQNSLSSPESPTSPPIYTSTYQHTQQQPVQWQTGQQKQPQTPQRPVSQPVLQIQQKPVAQQQPQQWNQQQQQPQQWNQQQKRQSFNPQMPQLVSPQMQPQERVIPVRIEDRPSVFDVKQEPGHHQFKQPSPHHQQRWGQPNQWQNQSQQQTIQPQQSTGSTFIIPITIEGNDKKPVGPATTPNVSHVQQNVRNGAANISDNQNQAKGTSFRIIPVQIQQPEPAPVQSRSFRVLQKITDTDSMNNSNAEQIRKLQLSDEDKILLNKVKEQVDNDSSLHHEEDPRYRGPAIPSKAFRFLQSITDSCDAQTTNTMPRPASIVNKKQNRNSKTFEETQANLPPSEQQVQEPKKYMGGTIPSRSFRILQAMTAPESVATQENRQADYHCQTENNVPGNQQGILFPPCPPPFWTPETGWWGYYPLPCPGVTNDSSSRHPDNIAYIYFPIYGQTYPRFDLTDKNVSEPFPGGYPPCFLCVPPQKNFDETLIDLSNSNDGNLAISNEIVENEEIKERNVKDDKNGFPDWNRENSMSRTSSDNSKDSDCTTAMNITDEEEIPETIVHQIVEEEMEERKVCSNGSVNVNVPNYTYIDTSDSSDSTDTESRYENESVPESSKISSDNDSEETSSDSDDSESYLAYSTGLNPHGRLEDKENDKGSLKKSIFVGSIGKRETLESSQSNNDCNSSKSNNDSNSSKGDNNSISDAEEIAQKLNEDASFRQFTVASEDLERSNSEGQKLEVRNVKETNDSPFEATDDPPDDDTTVSVSLPLKFKFSVSENNEDVTTVIVGDSTVKPERFHSKQTSKLLEGKKLCLNTASNLLEDNETTVDFTLKRNSFPSKRVTTKNTFEKIKEEKEEDSVVPHVNFTLRKIPSRLKKMNCEETVETEFTIRRKPREKKEIDWSIKETDKNSESLNEESLKPETSSESHEICENDLKPKVIVSNYTCSEETVEESSDFIQKMEEQNATEGIKASKNEEDVEEKVEQDSKRLLSVQNSREETDDEDSGVTSDMSRMISEVDTDSECTSSKTVRRYQRTQTHSRLFRLLNDDSILLEGSEKTNEPSSGTDCLNLKINKGNDVGTSDNDKNRNFSYDDNYCSNYSSGLTSPEYSSVNEQSWRRLHDAENVKIPEQNDDVLQGQAIIRGAISQKEDPYYQTWKSSKSQTTDSDHDVVPSLAFKVLESKRPSWSYKVNVLCPRIRSTKNVPRELRTSRRIDSCTSTSSSSPTSFRERVKTDHC